MFEAFEEALTVFAERLKKIAEFLRRITEKAKETEYHASTGTVRHRKKIPPRRARSRGLSPPVRRWWINRPRDHLPVSEPAIRKNGGKDRATA